MTTIQIKAGDTWDVAHLKIRKSLFDLMPENTPERGDRLTSIYELLDLGSWKEVRTDLICQQSWKKLIEVDQKDRSVSYSLTNIAIDPELMTVELG